MNDKELLNKYTALSMQLQEEYLKEKQDFKFQENLNNEFVLLKQEILERMGN